jgi:hypothetical protein
VKAITLSVPKPFDDGPLYDDLGDLIHGSWPSGLPHAGITTFRKIGIPSGGREMCTFIVHDDDWPIDDLPNGWGAIESYIWTDDGYIPEIETDTAEYMKHKSTPADGEPINSDPIHGFDGWKKKA